MLWEAHAPAPAPLQAQVHRNQHFQPSNTLPATLSPCHPIPKPPPLFLCKTLCRLHQRHPFPAHCFQRFQPHPHKHQPVAHLQACKNAISTPILDAELNADAIFSSPMRHSRVSCVKPAGAGACICLSGSMAGCTGAPRMQGDSKTLVAESIRSTHARDFLN